MSIVCEFVGGPRDGEHIELPGAVPLRIPVARPPKLHFDVDYESFDISYDVVELRPELTRNGWKLFWREP